MLLVEPNQEVVLIGSPGLDLPFTLGTLPFGDLQPDNFATITLNLQSHIWLHLLPRKGRLFFIDFFDFEQVI